MDSMFKTIFRFRTSTPLEVRVAALGVCTKCHKKTLRECLNKDGYLCQQCSNCLTVFVNNSAD